MDQRDNMSTTYPKNGTEKVFVDNEKKTTYYLKKIDKKNYTTTSLR
jgi:hypothetical protein